MAEKTDVDTGRELLPDRGIVEIDGVEVEAERHVRAAEPGDQDSYLRLRWPDGSELFVRIDPQGEEEPGAGAFFGDIMVRAMADPVVMHVGTLHHNVQGTLALRWPRLGEGAWRNTSLGKMIEEHMHAAGIETLEELGERLGGTRDADPDRGEEVWLDFDAEFIERATWDHWHGVPPSFFRRLEEKLGLDEERGRELLMAWAGTEPDEEGYMGRGEPWGGQA